MQQHQLPWLQADEPFPPLEQAWGADAPAPGLLAAGATLDVARLRAAYAQCIFPWFSAGQPILWWSPDPRMVLPVAQFRLHRSLRKTLLHFRRTPGCEIRIDSDFAAVIAACAHSPRGQQSGTWIVPSMQHAYQDLHASGNAHSVETWVNGQLVGGLYCVSLGRAVFGESMFARTRDASKIALAALVALCRHAGVQHIDCQQNTSHLASLGAREIARAQFAQQVCTASAQEPIDWQFSPLYWDALLTPPTSNRTDQSTEAA